MNTDLQGRLKNTRLPYKKALLPLFEAVVNSIHAIEERGDFTDNDKIEIIINREETLSCDSPKGGRPFLGPIKSLIIKDSGVGFTDQNFLAFKTLDTSHKKDIGGRGIGRLMWLKAFEIVDIRSVYASTEGLRYRQFSFTADEGVREEITGANNPSLLTPITTVHLQNFYEQYRVKAPKTTDAIAKDILEHCMWYFIRRKGAPNITVSDSSTGEKINLQELFDSCCNEKITPQNVVIGDSSFEFDVLKIRNSIGDGSKIFFCADNRVVKSESFLQKFGKLNDTSGDFVCHCYVTSNYLDSRVCSDRLGFDIDSEKGELFEDSDISLKQILNLAEEHCEVLFKAEIQAIREKGREKAQKFVESKAPRYRKLLSHLPDDYTFMHNASEKDIELELHKEYYNYESGVIQRGHELLNPPETMSLEEYKQQLKSFITEMSDVKNSDLSAYVQKRHLILKILNSIISKRLDQKYEREETVHKLIFPMREVSDNVEFLDSNLWIIDERLAFHHYLASDKPISTLPITDSKSRLEPDIFLMQLDNIDSSSNIDLLNNPVIAGEAINPDKLASVSIIEFKRPMRDNASDNDNPLKQVYDYFREILNNNVKTYKGRPIQISNLRRFAYIICDLTESMRKTFENYGCKVTRDGNGYYTFNEALQVEVSIIPYDRLVTAAEERNRAFFDQLGLPCVE